MSESSAATPWVEKYRPKSLTDVSHQSEVVSTLQSAVRTNRLPHLLFYGPPGTGKTSVALALCRTLWHPSQFKRRVLELNASDERGISVVRDKIKHFASLSVGNSNNQNSTSSSVAKKNFFQKTLVKTTTKEQQNVGSMDMEVDGQEGSGNKGEEDVYPNPPFKVIILDEADTVTPDAQAALRRIIEAYSKITRFILICNYVTRIIEPLASRCAKFRFQSLPPSSMKNRLSTIAHAEGCRFTPNNEMNDEEKENEAIDEILAISHGDMRRAVTTLQSAHTLCGSNGYIQKDNIAEMAGLPPSSIISSILSVLRNKQVEFKEIESTVLDVMLEGYALEHILRSLLKEIIVLPASDLGDIQKAEIAIKIAEVDKHLIDGADECLQFLMVTSFIQKCFRDMN